MTLILIVDDNELNLELAHDVLELEGFDIVTANSGQEGIEKAEKLVPDLILMDMRMPGMSGLNAMLTLHSIDSTRDIPIAALTASAMKGEEQRLLDSGFDAYLQKPINPSKFGEQVKALLNASGE